MASSSIPSGLKRKLTDACTCSTSEPKFARIVSQNVLPSVLSLQKRHCSCPKLMQPSLAESCLNYLNSGVPERIMFYRKNQWLTFPEPALSVLIKGFKEDRSSTVVFCDGQTTLVDFLSMTAVNLQTKKHRSIAWIDESGKCVFPPLFIDQESSKELRVAQPGRAEMVAERALRESQSLGLSAADMLRKKIVLVEKDSEQFLSVQNQFLSGMGPFAAPDVVLNIYRYHPDSSDSVAQSRLVEFERRMGVGLKGNGFVDVSHVTSGWFGCVKRELARILIYGFSTAVKPNEGTSGTNLYLMPEDRSFACVNLCDVDEKGVQHMLLCRVITYIPKGGNDLNCKYYVVPSVDADSRIYPEFIVTFKLSPVVREYLMGLNGRRLSEKRVTKFVRDMPTVVMLNYGAGPKTPCMSFVSLFAEVQDGLCPIARELLALHYDEMKNKIIMREELVRKIRIVVGDELLRSTLIKLQHTPSSWNNKLIANANQHDAMAAASELISGPPISVVCDSEPVDTSLSVAIGTNRRSPSIGTSHLPPKRAVCEPALPENFHDGIDHNSGARMRYLSIEHGMKLNNAAIDSILRAAKLEKGP